MNEQTAAAMLAAMTPDIVAGFRTAIEIGKWPDGRRLSDDQRATCMQAVLLWELKNLPEQERTGYIDRGTKEEGELCASHDAHDHDHEQPVSFR